MLFQVQLSWITRIACEKLEFTSRHWVYSSKSFTFAMESPCIVVSSACTEKSCEMLSLAQTVWLAITGILHFKCLMQAMHVVFPRHLSARI